MYANTRDPAMRSVLLRAVDRQRAAAADRDGADVVDAVGVIGVVVREEHGVDPLDASLDELQADPPRRCRSGISAAGSAVGLDARADGASVRRGVARRSGERHTAQ